MFINKIRFEELNFLISNWKWSELAFGLKRNYVTPKDIIQYANGILSQEINHMETVIKMVIAEEEEVDDILEELISDEEIDEQDIISKWIFAFIYYAYKYSHDNVYEVIEEVYGEFDYAEEISNLVRYMPCEDTLPIDKKIFNYIEKNRNIWK